MLTPCLHFLFANWLYGEKMDETWYEGSAGAVVFMASAFSWVVILC
jgi:hypothetical protein